MQTGAGEHVRLSAIERDAAPHYAPAVSSIVRNVFPLNKGLLLMKYKLGIGVVCLAIVGLVLSVRSLISAHPQNLASKEQQPPSGRAPDDGQLRITQAVQDARIETLASEVNKLNQEIKTLRSVPDDKALEMPTTSLSPTRSREQESAAFHEYMQEVASKFRSERTDAAWATASSSTIKQAIGLVPPLQGGLRDVECRSQTCRVEMIDNGTEAFSTALPPLASALAKNLNTIRAERIDAQDGKKILVMYMSNEQLADVSAARTQ